MSWRDYLDENNKKKKYQLLNSSENEIQPEQTKQIISQIPNYQKQPLNKNSVQKEIAYKKSNDIVTRFLKRFNEIKSGNYDGKELPAPKKKEIVGNVNIKDRPMVLNDDGTISTIRSMSFYDDKEKKEVLVPTVINGKVVSDEEAIKHYRETGEHLGKFDTVDEANAFAEKLHNYEEGKLISKSIANKLQPSSQVNQNAWERTEQIAQKNMEKSEELKEKLYSDNPITEIKETEEQEKQRKLYEYDMDKRIEEEKYRRGERR